MATKQQRLQEVVNRWASNPCPFCGRQQNPVWVIILDSYALDCRECGALIEAFEIGYDDQGAAHIVDHFIPSI